MEKCASVNHKEIDAVSYCGECKVYLCNKCNKFHSEIFVNHNSIKLEGKDITELFTGFCKEKSHKAELKYFCKKHNVLCCAECITKLKGKENGQHSDCDICFIEDIENTKRNKLKENIKCLEDISINLEQKINEIKVIYEKIEKDKEELKLSIQKIFTKLRNALNDREDELLSEVDNKYNKEYFDKDITKDCVKLPNKVKISLEKGKEIENKWDNIKLNLLINNCINIEININEINQLNQNLNNINSENIGIKFYPKEDGINPFLDSIKTFGELTSNKFDSEIDFNENLINSWLNNRKFKTELLYRKSRDGSTPNDFHDKCDNKGITITIIETSKGKKFGGYTELSWDKSNSSKKDKSIFIFSFNKKIKNESNNNFSIYCAQDEGPMFDLGSMKVGFKKTLDKGKFMNQLLYANQYYLNLLTDGEENWDEKELELHQIIYI